MMVEDRGLTLGHLFSQHQCLRGHPHQEAIRFVMLYMVTYYIRMLKGVVIINWYRGGGGIKGGGAKI